MNTGSKLSEGLTELPTGRWFQSLSSTKRPSLRLFCFPYAGGNAYCFRSWQRHFPSDIDLCLVHLPGRGRRIVEPLFTRLKQIVQTIADLIVREPRPPYALYGHSMGAVICFELARELRRRHYAAPLRLFLSGRSAPNMSSRKKPIFNLSEEAFIAEVRRFNGTPSELLANSEAMRVFLPALRSDLEMLDTYEYCAGEPLESPITVYGGLQDTDAPVESLRAWEQQTSAECNVRMFAGDHFFIQDPGTQFIGIFVRDVLATVEQFARAVDA